MYNDKNKTQVPKGTENKSVRFIRGLSKRKFREENGCFFLEGERAVRELKSLGCRLRTLVYTESFYRSIENEPSRKSDIDFLILRADDTLVVSDGTFRSLCETVTPQGIGAVVDFPEKPPLDRLLLRAKHVLVLENIQDPGNLGTCIRTADAFSFDCVIAFGDCADMYNPKVLRSTVGSMFHIPVYYLEGTPAEVLERLKSAGITVCCAHPRGGTFSDDGTLSKGRKAVVIGNEGAGLTQGAIINSDVLVTIPMPGKAESLNAGIAASVLMYEMIRKDKGD